MKPIQIKLCNFTFTAPAGITDEQCGSLPCLRDTENHTITSFWKPEPQEAAAIAAGGLVMLTVHGNAHPMVALGACHTGESENATPPPMLNQEELFQAMLRLVMMIESCGGSPELTTASMLASDIRQAIGDQWNPANEYAAERVREIIQTSQP